MYDSSAVQRTLPDLLTESRDGRPQVVLEAIERLQRFLTDRSAGPSHQGHFRHLLYDFLSPHILECVFGSPDGGSGRRSQGWLDSARGANAPGARRAPPAPGGRFSLSAASASLQARGLDGLSLASASLQSRLTEGSSSQKASGGAPGSGSGSGSALADEAASERHLGRVGRALLELLSARREGSLFRVLQRESGLQLRFPLQRLPLRSRLLLQGEVLYLDLPTASCQKLYHQDLQYAARGAVPGPGPGRPELVLGLLEHYLATFCRWPLVRRAGAPPPFVPHDARQSQRCLREGSAAAAERLRQRLAREGPRALALGSVYNAVLCDYLAHLFPHGGAPLGRAASVFLGFAIEFWLEDGNPAAVTVGGGAASGAATPVRGGPMAPRVEVVSFRDSFAAPSASTLHAIFLLLSHLQSDPRAGGGLGCWGPEGERVVQPLYSFLSLCMRHIRQSAGGAAFAMAAEVYLQALAPWGPAGFGPRWRGYVAAMYTFYTELFALFLSQMATDANERARKILRRALGLYTPALCAWLDDLAAAAAAAKASPNGGAAPNFSPNGSAAPNLSPNGSAAPNFSPNGSAAPNFSPNGSAAPNSSTDKNTPPTLSTDGTAAPSAADALRALEHGQWLLGPFAPPISPLQSRRRVAKRLLCELRSAAPRNGALAVLAGLGLGPPPAPPGGDALAQSLRRVFGIPDQWRAEAARRADPVGRAREGAPERDQCGALTDTGRAQVARGEGQCAAEDAIFGGDPLDRPIRSYEVRALVPPLVGLTRFLNGALSLPPEDLRVPSACEAVLQRAGLGPALENFRREIRVDLRFAAAPRNFALPIILFAALRGPMGAAAAAAAVANGAAALVFWGGGRGGWAAVGLGLGTGAGAAPGAALGAVLGVLTAAYVLCAGVASYDRKGKAE